jgi:hypothetical protein
LRTKSKSKTKIIRRLISQKYEVIACIAFIIGMSGYSGFYFGWLSHHQTLAVAKTPVLDDRESRILSNLMDQTVGACYYDTYQSHNNNTITDSADVCDKIMMFNKQVCKTKHLEACDSEFLRKYLEGMGE